MPPVNLAVGDKVEVTFEGVLCGQIIQNKFHYRVASIVGGAIDQEAAFAALDASWTLPLGLYFTYTLFLPDNWLSTKNSYQVVKPQRYIAYKYAHALTGNSTFNALTANMAAVFTKRGNLGQRDNISTTHLPLSEDSGIYTNGKLTPATQATLATLAAFFKTDQAIVAGAVTVTYTPVILHPDGSATDITSVVVQDTVRVMRRRTVGIGI